MSLSTIVKEELLDYVVNNPYPNTHCIIGSYARFQILNNYVPRMQQILPPFVDLTIPTRLINFDPLFDDQIEFIHTYFDSKNIGFKYDDSDGMHIWRSDDYIIEVIIISHHFTYSHGHQDTSDNDDWFLKGLIDSALSINSKLIVQDYSGSDTSIVFKMMYEQCQNKTAFKNNILFDFTYGNNHCDVDLEKYKPIINSSGNFVNIMLMSVDELMPLFKTNPIIDEHILNYYINNYREIINIIPADYRRKMKIESGANAIGFVGYKKLYTISTSFDEIINILRMELVPIINILRHNGIMNSEKEEILNNLLTNHKNYTLTSRPDINEWSASFIKIADQMTY